MASSIGLVCSVARGVCHRRDGTGLIGDAAPLLESTDNDTSVASNARLVAEKNRDLSCAQKRKLRRTIFRTSLRGRIEPSGGGLEKFLVVASMATARGFWGTNGNFSEVGRKTFLRVHAKLPALERCLLGPDLEDAFGRPTLVSG